MITLKKQGAVWRVLEGALCRVEVGAVWSVEVGALYAESPIVFQLKKNGPVPPIA